MRVVSQLYPSYTEAERVVRALEAAGVPDRDITLISGEKRTAAGTPTTGTPTTGTGQAAETGAGTGATLGGVLGGGAGLLAGLGSLAIPGVGPVVAAGWLVATLAGAGVGAAAGGLIGGLTGAGISEAEARTYAEGINEGRTLVSVRVEGDATRVENILKSASTTGVGTTSAGTRAGADETIKVVREDVAIGKREVERGGVRVTSHVVETPVEERVTLHDETVRVERRPVDQTLGAVSPDAFQERVIEVRAVGEEPVVAKEARVVEEIGIRKQATDRVETVRDTVRETKVEVEGDTARAPGTGRPAPKSNPLPPKR